VHLDYIEHDEEIREGIKVTQFKHSKDNPVFVESESSLMYALEHCINGSTLVIDGHWVHGGNSTFGVWALGPAHEIAKKIADVVNSFPGKVAHINLLGCKSGSLVTKKERSICDSKVFFKYSIMPSKENREMAEFRNRATYVSESKGDIVFHPNSLAFQLLSKLDDQKIAVTAVPSYGYPYPPEDPKFNIASDSEQWNTKQHYWLKNKEKEEDIYYKLRTTKSITQINVEHITSSSKSPSTFKVCN